MKRRLKEGLGLKCPVIFNKRNRQISIIIPRRKVLIPSPPRKIKIKIEGIKW